MGWSIGAFLAVLAVAGLSYAFTITPLLRRIERLRGAAVRVGGPDYAAADDSVGDALAEIGATLDRSHARIEADRAELVARQEALERHLAEIAHDLRTPMGRSSSRSSRRARRPGAPPLPGRSWTGRTCRR